MTLLQAPKGHRQSNRTPSRGHTEDLGLNERTGCGTMGHNQVLKVAEMQPLPVESKGEWSRNAFLDYSKRWRKLGANVPLSAASSLQVMMHLLKLDSVFKDMLHIESHEIGIVSSLL